jgi:Tfp pilus assembly protein PilO
VFDELKIKYKALSLLKRLIICVLAGLLPGAYLYYDQATIVEEEFAAAEAGEKQAAQNLLDVDKKLKNLEKTESELAFTTEQLKKAETRLPNDVAIDEVLRQVAKSAKDSSVTIVNFVPGTELLRGDEYKYVEMPIKMVVEAHEYSQLCSWLDTIAGLKARIYLKSWNLKREVGVPEQDPGSVAGINDSQGLDEVAKAELEARRPRELLRLKLDAELSLYKLAVAGAKNTTGNAGQFEAPTAESNSAKDGSGNPVEAPK